MNILVKKDNQTFGPYTREEVIEFIQVEELSHDDLGSWEGEENWNSLNELLSLANEPESDSSIYDQFEDDDVDYEKMKEWEDVFQDDDADDPSEELITSEVNQEDGDMPLPLPVVQPNAPVAFESDTSAPPPFVAEEVFESEPTNFHSPTEEDNLGSRSISQQEYVPPPSPSLPLPPPPQASPISSKRESKEKSVSRGGRDRISSSHKIRGLNSQQTVIMVKGEGILSKIYSTSLVFIILFVVVVIIGFAGLIFAPDRVTPIFKKIGVPSGVIEAFAAPVETSKK